MSLDETRLEHVDKFSCHDHARPTKHKTTKNEIFKVFEVMISVKTGIVFIIIDWHWLLTQDTVKCTEENLLRPTSYFYNYFVEIDKQITLTDT